MAAASHVTIRRRIAVLFLLFALFMVFLVGRLVVLQFFKSDWLLENAVDQRVRDIPVEAKRGIIYDRNGKELAISINTESVYAIPAEVKDAEQTAAKLAAILGLNEEKILQKLKQRQAFVWIQRKVEAPQAREIKALNLPGIGLTPESKRYYPNDNLASHILGFAGVDSQGLDGVEVTFDQYLRGKAGRIVIEYDATGREIPYATHKYIAPEDGYDIYLTIDQVIQFIVERELEKALKDTQAKTGTIIAMNPKTGEILALANRPDYNPNHFADYSPKLWRNIAVSNSYEPGSTFKIITASTALQERVVRPESGFFDPGFIEVQGRNISCWKDGGHGSQSFVEVVKNSCNPGFVNVGLRLGKDLFYNYLDGFGFGAPTNIDLPGEAKGIVIPRDKVKPINIATISIGQGIAVTPIQLLTAAAAVANDGVLLKPQIVREIRAKDGKVVKPFQPEVIRQVISPEISRELRLILEEVVEEGTGKNAFIPGYRIAGKTGTAQKVGAGGYEQGKYVASFLGFAPANDPQIALLVVLDEPSGMYYGGQVAAPVFGEVMKDVLQYLKIPPQIRVADKNGKMASREDVTVPNLLNLTVAEAKKVAAGAGLSVQVEEEGERVVDQLPKPGSQVPGGTAIVVYTRTKHPHTVSEPVTVPDLTGKTIRETAALLAEVGLGFYPVGSGIAVRQEPAFGIRVEAGTAVTVYFAPEAARRP